MTDKEMIENLKCVIADISEQCNELKAENAALRDRLENAVELPRIIHPNETEWHIQYQNAYGINFSEIKFSKEAAEARLAELKGESKKTIMEDKSK